MKKLYLYPVLNGEKKACFAQSEPDAGGDPSRAAGDALQRAGGAGPRVVEEAHVLPQQRLLPQPPKIWISIRATVDRLSICLSS